MILSPAYIALSNRRRPLPSQPAPLFLDTYTGSLFAFSFRKLTSSYSGPCCIVRRSSDNAEQTINFSGNKIDISAVQSFCAGSSTGFVVKWFDQSGNNHHATSSANTQQFKIYESGSIITSSNGAVLMQSVNETGNQHLHITASLDLDTGLFFSCHIGTMLNTGGTGRVRPWISQFPAATDTFIHAYGDVNSSTGHNDGTWRYANTITSSATLESWAARNTATSTLFMIASQSHISESVVLGVTDRSSNTNGVRFGGFQTPDSTSRRFQQYSEVIHWTNYNPTEAELSDIFIKMNSYVDNTI